MPVASMSRPVCIYLVLIAMHFACTVSLFIVRKINSAIKKQQQQKRANIYIIQPVKVSSRILSSRFCVVNSSGLFQV